MEERFDIILLKEARLFLNNLDPKDEKKIYETFKRAKEINDIRIFKKLKPFDIWEFKVKNYRLFAFWDKREKNNNFVIVTHGIIKKTNKVPRKEITKALKIKAQYLKNLK